MNARVQQMPKRMPKLGRIGGLVAVLVAAAMLAPSRAAADVRTETVSYKVGDMEFQGFLAYPVGEGGQGGEKTPGVLVAPEWFGLNDYAKSRARQLAELGYVALAMDPYGGGKTTGDVKEAAQWSGALKENRRELRARTNAALETLRGHRLVDPERLAAIGYCFGGTAVLELARSGADLSGVVSFHGGLGTNVPAEQGKVKAQVLVLHGADDPFVPPAEVTAFQQEMQAAGVRWQLNMYGGAVHSFTNPNATGRGMQGVAYHELADKRSWEDMKDFFFEVFDRPKAPGAPAPEGRKPAGERVGGDESR